MKKIILLSVFLFGVIASAQTTFPTSIDKTFNWEEKDQNKTFNVTFLNGLKEIIIPQERLNNLIMNAVIKSKYNIYSLLTADSLYKNASDY